MPGSDTLALWAGLWMGLVGGAHCALMCGGWCVGLSGTQGGASPSLWAWHTGRLLGYATLGALVAGLAQGAHWLIEQAQGLRLVWVMLHLLVLAWGLTLLVLARQPVWVTTAAQSVWRVFKPARASSLVGVGVVGFFWVLLPCGLLYSVLVVAAYSGEPMQGALVMLNFALGSAVWLWLSPSVLRRLPLKLNHWRADWGSRLSGFMLMALALSALFMGMAHASALPSGVPSLAKAEWPVAVVAPTVVPGVGPGGSPHAQFGGDNWCH